MDIFKAIALGVLQGLTEFLPISSSGHLVLAQQFAGLESDHALAFDVCLHFGTLVAVVVYFRHDLFQMLRAVLGLSLQPEHIYLSRWWWLLGVATVPVVVVAIAFQAWLQVAFQSVSTVGLALLVTAAMLWYGHRRTRYGGVGPDGVGVRQAVLVGSAQALALIPGISRSGATIVGGIAVGLDATTAARFAFLLSIPAIAGAIVRNVAEIGSLLSSDPAAVVAGTVAAALTGAAAIEIMLRSVRVGRLAPFALYCFVLGLTALSAGWFA